MKRKTIYILIILLLIVLLPLWMWLAWVCTPKKKMVVAIVDKTVLTTKTEEHRSLNWVLNHYRYTKTSRQSYRAAQDYFGFFPLTEEKFRLKGLERFTVNQLEQLSNDCQATYFTDTYGIFSNEWYTGKNTSERSGMVYGGMSEQDIVLLKKMKEKHKLIITEFNCIGSPTPIHIRNQFENLFGLRWSGWIGRYFESLDTVINKELPRWLIANYFQQYGSIWPFKKGGIVFVGQNNEIVILEEETHLTQRYPSIVTGKEGQLTYGLPGKIRYTFWFDIMQPDTSINKVMAHFSIPVNEKGRNILSQSNIPFLFPAVTQHIDKDYQFYYFSADFCDNPIGMTTSFFRGIHWFKTFFYNTKDPMERNSFFWNYYRPLMSTILRKCYKQ